MVNTLSVYTMVCTIYGGPTGHTGDANTIQTRPLSSYGMTAPMREVIGRALSLNARPLHALLATSTCTTRVRAPTKVEACFSA